ncbi:MAG: substrate-binding domain-containing protein [Gomphosphaeria aponina SAG 52.96 = DSM 107014]|uniref:Substrate-binding domain-containing protein n=1 Tax=Gomphosphaeria aponina SAG 52.96 = DSM 107014 TaxID=1521640 RepID=A0A941GYW5_9CHRO|nr:substrate-binding domain-containing protein [Gomphosphaeria aponina SAG 52.96 = DSM 107014]
MKNQLKKTLTSLAIILASLGLTYVPIPGLETNLVVLSGTELEEPLKALEQKFEAENPNINLELKFQGSQDIVNNYIDQKNDFTPTVLIPASGEILAELNTRWVASENSEAFYNQPQPIAKTMLVGIAWPDRGKVIFPTGRFEWKNIQQAMIKRNWGDLGGDATWGSFDFVTTDPTRSNSGQLTLGLWAISELGGSQLNSSNLNTPAVQDLFSLVKRSLYQPPRSTDILLQEFIARGPNDADVATVYESIALYRWSQASTTQGKAYQIYYLDPTIETVATAAIVRRDIDNGEAKAASKFLDFLTQPEQQEVFVQYGYRPVLGGIKLDSVANSPWSQNIPGVEIDPGVTVLPPLDTQVLGDIQRLWERGN